MVATLNLRPEFRLAQGPGDFGMPVDPTPPLPDFDAAYANHQLAYHEGWLDRLNEDRTWGSMNPAEQAGSGIVFGYAWDDLPAVLVANIAMDNTVATGFGPDGEHHIRKLRYPIHAWEMTHDQKFARKIVYLDQQVTGAFSETGMIHLDDPGWIPDTLAQFHAMAQQRPHEGLPWNARKVGWYGYGRLMRHKVDRHCTRAWIDMLLETCKLAAIPGTGQQVAVDDRGDTGITSTFHEAILIHTVLIACYRFRKTIPRWVLQWMAAVKAAPRLDYYGLYSPVRFWKTVDGRLVPSQTAEQQGDPGFAYWSTNCVALHKLDPAGGWNNQATLIGPQQATSEDSRQLTLLLRGLAA
jgi:hypothetical protein